MGRILKGLGALVALVVVAVAGVAAWFWVQVGQSVPVYSGELALAGLSAPVTVERDALGVVTIRSANALDEARALGFVHGQERFFQMDLLRRSAAGELAALVGAAAVPLDKSRRIHDLRATAARVVADAPADYRELLVAYAAGVNAGLDALDEAPFEYLLLRAEPAPWRPEDSVLAIGAMFFDLQGGHGRGELSELTARAALPPVVADLLFPTYAAGDAPIDGSDSPPPVLPTADEYDLRALPRAWFGEPLERDAAAPLGSNNWAVAGAHNATGRGLVANDMHLGLQVPSIWFRVDLVRPETRLTGVTLPGMPLLVVGSNGRVAWGFTNSYGDWLDVVPLAADEPLETVTTTIDVAHGEPVAFEWRRSAHGPVAGELADGTPYAIRWTAHHPEAYAPGFLALARAGDVDAAIDAANRSGIPAQNFVVADASGRVGWTIMGRIPRRTADGWDGWLEPHEYPRVVDPADGRVWTANSRVVGGDALALVGDGGYALGQRARQIRDRLAAIGHATPTDMLAVQLDDDARLMQRWRDRLVGVLDDDVVAGDARLAAARDALHGWDGHAAVDAVGFRLMRAWRGELVDAMVAALGAPVRQRAADWRYSDFRADAWAWALVDAEPAHLLDPRYRSWREFELAALRAALDDLGVRTAADLAARTWGERNTVRVRHPLSGAVPLLGRWLDMPAQPLPGESFTPRVQGVAFGASQRMAVSPGDEANGYFHMPGGQAGNPRSPYYGAGHDDWARGRPTPFLPGPAQHTLTLVPPAGSPRVAPLPLPAGAHALAPNLSHAPDGSVLLSWLEPVGDGHALRWSRRVGDAWTDAREVARGDDWFVNWADFPALVETGDGTLFAHWLQKSGGAPYAYDVMVVRSRDGGASWSAPMRLHDDTAAAEHGFVTLLPVADDRVRAVWLDGRETPHGGAMTLRARELWADGRVGEEQLLDDSVCDCCQTAAAVVAGAVAVAYRDRTDDEVRDIRLLVDGASRALGDDGWRIAACPVNGPALAADGERLFAAWFTAAGDRPRVHAAFSTDGGTRFGDAFTFDDGDALGRVHAVLLDDGSALVGRLAGAGPVAEIRLRRVVADGRQGAPIVVASSRAARASGFPRLARAGDEVLVVWTEPDGLRAATVSPPSTW